MEKPKFHVLTHFCGKTTNSQARLKIMWATENWSLLMHCRACGRVWKARSCVAQSCYSVIGDVVAHLKPQKFTVLLDL